MTYVSFAKQYKGKTLEDSGAFLSKDFKKFAKAFESMLTEEAQMQGWEMNTCNVGHYSISGYLHKDGHYLYFSYSPARMRPLNFESSNVFHSVMLRYAKDSQDYIGGRNNFCAVKDISSTIQKMDRMKRFFI